MWPGEGVAAGAAAGQDYGSVDVGRGQRVMVEFVSANPTGPMTIGNARGGVLGDTLASVLQKAGYDVWREFYVNDAGNQVDLFGKSIEARYLQICLGEDAVEFPDNGYHGDDIRELAKLIYDKEGARYMDMPSEERCRAFVAFGLPHNIALMKKHLERYRIHFDQWFLESSLHESGYVAETVKLLTDNGVSQKITVENLGNVANLTGGAVVVHESYTGVYGLFYIDSDVHTWKKGLYLNKLTVNFRRIMDEQEAGALPNADGSSTASSTETWSYVNKPERSS
jgi:arginyl-tRNA synthetase